MANPNEPFQVLLQRLDQSQSWGFRLQGGNDFKTPLSVSMINPGSVAEQCGLKAGDAVLSINNTPSDELAHEEAKRMILMSGNAIPMLVMRGSVQVWKPKVTPVEQLRPDQLREMQDTGGDPIVQKTSLAANKMEPLRIGSAHNRSARPFPGFGGGSSQQSYQQPPPQQQQQMAPAGGMGGGYDPYAAQGGGYDARVQGGGYQDQMQGGGYQGQVQGGGYQAQTQGMQQSMAGLSLKDSSNLPQQNKSPTYRTVHEGNLPTSRSKSPALIAIERAVERASNKSPIHMSVPSRPDQMRSVSPTFLAVHAEDEAHSKSPVPSSVSPGAVSNGSDQSRSKSPTLLAVEAEEWTHRRSPVNTQLTSPNKTAFEMEQKEGEGISIQGYSNPYKQSRSFRMLEAELSAAEVSAVTGAPVSGLPGMPAAAPAPSGGTPFSGFKSIKAPENKPVNTERQQAQYMTCKGCGSLCVGVFVRIKGDPYHPECFKCAQCGKNLKQQGHLVVGGQLYCEVCVRQVAAPPAPDMVPVPVNR